MRKWAPTLAAALVLVAVLWEFGGRKGPEPEGAPPPSAIPAATPAEGRSSQVPVIPGEPAPAAPPSTASRGPLTEAPGRTVVLLVRIGGRPALPEEYMVGAGDFVSVGPGLSHLVEDRDRGEIRFPVRRSNTARSLIVWLHAPGYWPVQAAARSATDDGDFDAAVDLEPGQFLVAKVVPAPAEKQDPALRIGVAEYSPEAGTWSLLPPLPGFIGSPSVVLRGVRMYGPLGPGRYTLFDQKTGLMGEPVDVAKGDPPREVLLDLSKVASAEGRVEFPAWKSPLASMEEVRLFVEGEGTFKSSPGTVGPDGRFSVEVPGDRPVRIRPWHPVLVPAEPGGTAEVMGVAKNLVLRLVAANWCTARLSPSPVIRPWHPRLRVLRFAGQPGAHHAGEHLVIQDGGTIRFGGYPAGTWTLWIDAHGFAPAVLRDVRLPDGYFDLCEVRLARGSGVRVRVLWDPGSEPPPVIIWATALDPPQYRRATEAKPDPFVVLTGLGAGHFKVEALDKGATRRVEAEVTLDGLVDAELTLDLR